MSKNVCQKWRRCEVPFFDILGKPEGVCVQTPLPHPAGKSGVGRSPERRLREGLALDTRQPSQRVTEGWFYVSITTIL